MTVARRARAIGNLGGLGASHQKLPLSPGEVMPALLIVSASISYGRKETPIWNNGKWLNGKFPAVRNADCTFRIFVEGTGKALVSAIFNDGNNTPCYLFVRRMNRGEHFVTVQIPYAQLPGFRFSIGNKASAKIDTRFLSNREKKGLSSNMLLLNETKNQYYTEALGGLAGLGAGHSGMTDDYHPSFIKSADEVEIKTASKLNTIWSGSITKHRWAKHGFSGMDERRNRKVDKDPGFFSPSTETQQTRQDAAEGPLYVCDSSGFYAFRGSTYQMRYDEKGTMLGYDAMENLERGMPAGVPICMVMQYFVHDQVNPGLSSFAGGPQDQLGGWWSRRADEVVAFQEDLGDRVLDTYEGAENFVKDPSLSNATSIITAPLGGNSGWHYADGTVIRGNKLFLVNQDIFYGMNDSDTFIQPESTEGLFTSYGDASAIPYKLNKQANIRDTFKLDGSERRKSSWAMNVEWYNPSTKKWSPPSKHPKFNFTTNSKGKIKIIFRLPRQLDPKSDASEIERGVKAGFPNYSIEKSSILKAYPFATKMDGKWSAAFNLIGRVEAGQDSDSAKRTTFTEVIGGKSYAGRQSLKAILFCDPPSHWRSGMTHPSGVGAMNTGSAFKVHFADPTKFTYLDNPEIDFSYYADGEMKPGSTVVIIGKALGTVNSNNCILTTRGWENGIPKEIIGRAEPLGDYPAHVASSVNSPNSQKPRTTTGKEGTERADFLELAGHITTSDLADNISVSGEEVLKSTWKKIFGIELDLGWFLKMKLSGHDPADPTKYLIKGSRGETYSFPFSIAWFQLPPYYTGPYLDYNEEGQLQPIEGRPYAIANKDDPLFIIASTPFGKLMQQRFDIVAETETQKELLDEGFTPDETFGLNDMDFDAEDVTELMELDKRKADFLKSTDQVHALDEPPKMTRYTNDWVKANFKFGNKDIIMRPDTPPPVLSGFSNQGNFYVEDVTEKWGTLNGAAYTNDDFDVNMMPLPMPGEQEEETPFIGFAGLSGWDEVVEAGGNVGKVVGRASAEFGKEQVKAIADLDTKETLVFGGLAIGAGIVACGIAYAGFYGVPKGVLTGVAAIRRAGGRNKADVIGAKAEARERTGGAISGLFAKAKPLA